MQSGPYSLLRTKDPNGIAGPKGAVTTARRPGRLGPPPAVQSLRRRSRLAHSRFFAGPGDGPSPAQDNEPRPPSSRGPKSAAHRRRFSAHSRETGTVGGGSVSGAVYSWLVDPPQFVPDMVDRPDGFALPARPVSAPERRASPIASGRRFRSSRIHTKSPGAIAGSAGNARKEGVLRIDPIPQDGGDRCPDGILDRRFVGLRVGPLRRSSRRRCCPSWTGRQSTGSWRKRSRRASRTCSSSRGGRSGRGATRQALRVHGRDEAAEEAAWCGRRGCKSSITCT